MVCSMTCVSFMCLVLYEGSILSPHVGMRIMSGMFVRRLFCMFRMIVCLVVGMFIHISPFE
jgi:hypothetical protein